MYDESGPIEEPIVENFETPQVTIPYGTQVYVTNEDRSLEDKTVSFTFHYVDTDFGKVIKGIDFEDRQLNLSQVQDICRILQLNFHKIEKIGPYVPGVETLGNTVHSVDNTLHVQF